MVTSGTVLIAGLILILVIFLGFISLEVMASNKDRELFRQKQLEASFNKNKGVK